MDLYKLATIENCDLDYNEFSKRELIQCILDFRATYFSRKTNILMKTLPVEETIKNIRYVLDHPPRTIEWTITFSAADVETIWNYINQLETNRDEAIKLLQENVAWGEDMNSQQATEILERGKE